MTPSSAVPPPPPPPPPSPDTPAAPVTASAPAPVGKQKQKRKRISRWDRPKEPHDWRWAVGHVGRALITLGLLMFGFVAYQLWGTGIQTARAQDHLKNQFHEQLDTRGVTQDTIAPATSTTAPPVDTTVTSTATSDPTATTVPPADTTTTSTPPVHQIYGNVQPGDSLGEIRIPTIDLDFYIVAGVSKQNLSDGVGHFPNTPLPGQLGNSALAGHRTTHLAPFYDLDKLEPGDEVQVYTAIGGAYVYIVTDSVVVSPSDYQVVTDSDPTKATLTLITCTPIGTSSHRLVIHAALDPTRGSPVGEASIYYGEGDAATFDTTLPDEDTLPAEDGATTVPAAPDASVAATTPATDAATTTIAAATAGSTVDSVNPAAEFADDAFDAGWFDDSAAFPHVAAWAALFALVWYGAYRLAKWRRNAFIGIFVGIVPFVVVLYFLYENVNRLLPAAI